MTPSKPEIQARWGRLVLAFVADELPTDMLLAELVWLDEACRLLDDEAGVAAIAKAAALASRRAPEEARLVARGLLARAHG